MNPATRRHAPTHPRPKPDRSRESPPAAEPAELAAPVGTIASAPRLLAEAGADADETARAAGIEPGIFADPTTPISFGQMGRYLAACVWAAKDDRFPLRVGLAEGPSALDAIGYLALHSPDVRTSLLTLRAYVHHVAGALSVTREGGLAAVDYTFLHPRIEGAGLITEAAMGLLLAVTRQLCGPAWSPVEMRLSRPLPPRPAAWRRSVRAPVVFGTGGNRIVFPARWLDHPVEHADKELRRILHERVAELEARRSADLSTRVGSAIRGCLLSGKVTPAQVAVRLGTSTRTLSRRLGARGTSFEAVLDQTRFDLACHLLADSTASMMKITELLGFAHSSAFTRAFRRWSGTSPRAWREENRHREAAELAVAAASASRSRSPPVGSMQR
jgi:AraC-like DNA-binding protein